MDTFHARCARVALAVLGRYGFALAGGYAVQLHGIVNRPSDDVDLFTDLPNEEKFKRATTEAEEAWKADGLTVICEVSSPKFARYQLSDEYGQMKAELSYDAREEPPVLLDIGPVISRNDSVANKVLAVYGRSEARDYIDVYSAATSGGYSKNDLEEMAAARDKGFVLTYFAQALRACQTRPDADYVEYGFTAPQIRALHKFLLQWADEIDSRQ